MTTLPRAVPVVPVLSRLIFRITGTRKPAWIKGFWALSQLSQLFFYLKLRIKSGSPIGVVYVPGTRIGQSNWDNWDNPRKPAGLEGLRGPDAIWDVPGPLGQTKGWRGSFLGQTQKGPPLLFFGGQP
jgi:hypothetical protein